MAGRVPIFRYWKGVCAETVSGRAAYAAPLNGRAGYAALVTGRAGLATGTLSRRFAPAVCSVRRGVYRIASGRVPRPRYSGLAETATTLLAVTTQRRFDDWQGGGRTLELFHFHLFAFERLVILEEPPQHV